MNCDGSREGVVGAERSAKTPNPAADALDALPAPSDLSFSAAGNLYATHGLHAFAARCPPPLVAWALRSFSRPGDVVLDPMSGSGTAMVEACLLGRVARGADIDPLARLITKVKATPLDLNALDKSIAEVARLLHRGRLDDTWRPELPGCERWFRPEVAADLARIREAIFQVGTDPDVADLLWLCFSSLIVARTSVANARDLVHSRHHYREWECDPGCIGRFAVRMARARRMMAEYRDQLSVNGISVPDVSVIGGDARMLDMPDDHVDMVFTSPPYCSALDYTRAHMFAVAWMPEVLSATVEQYRILGREYVGSERAPLAEATPEHPMPTATGVAAIDEVVDSLKGEPRRAWIVYRYFRDMQKVLNECARVIRPGGYVVLVICPSNLRRVAIPTHRLLAELAGAAPRRKRLEFVDWRERTIHDHRRVMPYLPSAFGQRMRTEYVLVLRRPQVPNERG
ncbi:MAG: DNA methyltransferase [Mycobacterium sp.]|nr:DNA methyltransferase [Mycobacterium sp.]MDI3315947.1 DNA methyltransferase [Mycobacterium sp.]